MNKWLIGLVIVIMSLFAIGCSEPFVNGFIAGTATMEALAQQKQQEFNDAMEKLNSEKANIDALIDKVEDADVKAFLQNLADEKTMEYIKQLKTADWSDPKVATGYGIALLSVLTAGYQKYQRAKETAK